MSKLVLETISTGDGINYPKTGQSVTIHYCAYIGQTVSENKWDSTRDRGKPFRFKLGVGQVIKGLDIGVGQLSIGERAKIIIPPRLGYGKDGFPSFVPPNSFLTFDIDLVSYN